MKRTILSVFSVVAITLIGFCPAFAGGPPLPVPEPVTCLFAAVGVAGVAVYGLIRKRQK